MNNTKNINHYNNWENEIDLSILLHDFIHGGIKYLWLLIVLFVLMNIIIFIYCMIIYIPMYKCEATFTIGIENVKNSDEDFLFYYDKNTSNQMATTFPYIIENDFFTDLINQDMNTDVINGTITSSAVENSNMFTITVTSSSAEDAKKILDSVIKNYPVLARYVIGNTNLNMIEISSQPDEPFNKISKKNIILTNIIISSIIWFVFLIVYAFCRKTVKSESQIRTIINAVSLGTVPKIKRKNNIQLTINNKYISEAFCESIRKIALRLFKNMNANKQKVLTITSLQKGDGCSTIAINISYALSEMNKNVLLIHQKKDNMSEAYKFIRTSSSYDKKEIAQNVNKIKTFCFPNNFKSVICDGLKLTLNMLIKHARNKYDFIIIDAGSELHESIIALQYSDLFLMTIRQDVSAISSVSNKISQLYDYNTEFAGCILNGVNDALFGYSYKYGKHQNTDMKNN